MQIELDAREAALLRRALISYSQRAIKYSPAEINAMHEKLRKSAKQDFSARALRGHSICAICGERGIHMHSLGELDNERQG